MIKLERIVPHLTLVGVFAFEIDSEVRVTDSEVRVSAAVCYTLQKKFTKRRYALGLRRTLVNRSLNI